MEKQKYLYDYPKLAVATDCVIFGFGNDGLSILLVKRGIEPYKDCWAFPGGFMRMDEDAETCARRELKEETGLMSEYIEPFGVFTDVNRDPRGRVISIAHLALVKKAEVVGGDDAADAVWFPVDQIPHLAFDHDHILRLALKTLKEKIHFEPIGFDLLPDVFSMPQLQNLYESILEVKFDRRNFSSKMLKLGILDVFKETPAEKGRRITIKYRFNPGNYKLMKAKGFRLEF